MPEDGEATATLSEVHIVSFESQDGYESYMADEERQAHRTLLDGAVVVRANTRVVLSYKMPTYISGDRNVHVGVWEARGGCDHPSASRRGGASLRFWREATQPRITSRWSPRAT